MSELKRDVTVSTERIYEGKILNLRVDTIDQDGRKAKREIVEHKGACAIAAVTDEGDILFVRQYRIAVDDFILEIPAGLIDPGENPEETAVRELEEETGYIAGNIEKVQSCYTSPGFTDESIHIFLAWNLKEGEMNLDEGENLTVEKYPIDSIDTLIENADDSKTVMGLLHLARNRERIMKDIK